MRPKTRFTVLYRDGFQCQYCGKRGTDTELEVDHILPRAEGGTDDEDNLITSCYDCNRGKSGTPITAPPTAPKKRGRPPKAQPPTDALVHRWFYSFSLCSWCHTAAVQWQGYVVAALPNGRYLVQLFEWVVGDPSNQRIVSIEQMETGGWHFYGHKDDFTFAWEEVWQRRHKTCGPNATEP